MFAGPLDSHGIAQWVEHIDPVNAGAYEGLGAQVINRAQADGFKHHRPLRSGADGRQVRLDRGPLPTRHLLTPRAARASGCAPGEPGSGATLLDVPVRSVLVLLLALVLVTAACSKGAAKADQDRTASIYAAVVRGLLDPTAETASVVYVAPLPDQKAVSLETQAAVVADLKEEATVRFVDALSEAVNADAPEAPAKDGFVIVLGPVPTTGTSVELDAERYESEDEHADIRLRVTANGDVWTAEVVDSQMIPPTTSP